MPRAASRLREGSAATRRPRRRTRPRPRWSSGRSTGGSLVGCPMSSASSCSPLHRGHSPGARPYRPADLFDRLAQIPRARSLSPCSPRRLVTARSPCSTRWRCITWASACRTGRPPWHRSPGMRSVTILGFGWLSGGAVRYRLYTAWGLSSLDIGIVLAFNTVTTFLGLGSIPPLPASASRTKSPNPPHSPAGVVVLGLALGLAVAGYVALPRPGAHRSGSPAGDWTCLDRPSRPAQIVLSLLDWMLAAVSTSCCWPAWRSASRPSLACSGSPIWAG